MPYARITLRKGKSQVYLRVLSDSLHQALVESFEVPPADRFQIFDQCSAQELIVDPNYLCGPRSEDYVLITITAGRERTPQTKAAFYRTLVERLAAAPGIRPEDVMIVITTTTTDDWSFGRGISASAIPAFGTTSSQ